MCWSEKAKVGGLSVKKMIWRCHLLEVRCVLRREAALFLWEILQRHLGWVSHLCLLTRARQNGMLTLDMGPKAELAGCQRGCLKHRQEGANKHYLDFSKVEYEGRG